MFSYQEKQSNLGNVLSRAVFYINCFINKALFCTVYSF